MDDKTSQPNEEIHLSIFLPSLAGGGAERVMTILVNQLSQRGYNVNLILACARGSYLEDVHHDIEIIDLKAAGVTTALPDLVKYLNHSKPKTLLTAMNHCNVIASLATLLSKSKTRLVLSERLHFGAHLKQTNSLKEKIVKILMHWLYPKADKVICVSKEIEKYLISNYKINPNKVITIYNPVVDLDLINASKKQIDHNWVTKKDIRLIVTAGRLNIQKNHALLLHAFKTVLESTNARLIIFGEGELRAELEQTARMLEIQDNVLLPGFEKNIFAYFNKADLFVLSSDYEGLPGVVIQAMACGLPIVSTDCPSGPAEILENGKWGKLVPTGDSDALAKAMIATLNTKSTQPDVKERAGFFSVKSAIDQYCNELYLNHQSTSS